MNITHIVENLHRGGLERMVVDLVAEQHAAGHDCQVICLFNRGLLAEELDRLGVPVHACHKRHGFDLRTVLRTRQLLRAQHADVLHTHNMTAHYYAVAATFGTRPACLVNTRHGMGAMKSDDRSERLYGYCVWRTDHVITVCDMVRRRLIEQNMLAPEKIQVVFNGIRMEQFTHAPQAARKHVLEALDLPPNSRLIGSIGRLNRPKDPVTLVRAFAILHRALPQAVLLLVGDGGLRKTLEKLVADEGLQDCVRLLGDRGDVNALLPALDLFALVSLSEGFSLALLEACATALPIVATRVGGNPEIVQDGVSGLLVEPRDVATLAEAMLSLMHDRERATAMGRAALEWVERNGSLQAMVSHYQDIYSECV